ncbi:hypothetical protein SAMN05880574_10363 [Chryseobacterium sp. RU37D]|uniref:hypothetical protein n=1 Tax=Chryseobacterium sp. RU37D TaxID=1907397 RepID=UPI000955ABE0|nr:hypothetical protein [Chryseobacterium sp. RU37D]SIP97057.1 hypothetical protein SAMN05880574_10363 [Chryseobacterium sp. RU37D]
MKKIIPLFLLKSFIAFSQIGIGTADPDPSSMLDINATDKGILIPRVNLSTNTIVNPQKSLLIWNTDNTNNSEGFFFFDGNIWKKLINNSWNVNGNIGTSSVTDFLGNIDNMSLSIRTNNIPRMKIGNEVAGNSFTNVDINLNPTTSYSGAIISTNNTVNMQNGSSAANVFGIENLLYLRNGSTISNTFRAIRNRLWNIQTTNYPNVVGTLNEYRGEVTSISSFKGFINTYDLRAGSNTADMRGFSNEFTGQINGNITNYYGFYSGIHSSLVGYTNYYGFYQENIGSAVNRYSFYYDGDDVNTKDVVITGAGKIGIGTNLPHSSLQTEGSLSTKYDTTANNTGIYTLSENNFTLRIFNQISSVNLPNPNTCKGRIYILIGSNGISTKSITVNGGAVIYDDVQNLSISTISSGQRYQIQSDGKDWIVIGN